LPSLLLYGFLALAIIGSLGGISYKIHDAGYQQAKQECERAAAEQREAEAKQASKAATKLEASDAKAKVVYRTIRQTVDKVVEKPVYRNVCLDDPGLRVANDALSGRAPAATAKPDGTVPGAVPAK